MDAIGLEAKGVQLMSNVVKVLKAEIMRISRKEAKGATQESCIQEEKRNLKLP